MLYLGNQSPLLPASRLSRHILVAVCIVIYLVLSATALRVSATGNPYPPYKTGGCNCVWYAWQAWHDMGVDLPVPAAGACNKYAEQGDACLWTEINSATLDATGQATSVASGSTPQVHAIAVFQPGIDGTDRQAGHVAVVTSIGANGSFTVSEENYYPSLSGPGCGSPIADHFMTGPGVTFLYLPGTPSSAFVRTTDDNNRIYRIVGGAPLYNRLVAE